MKVMLIQTPSSEKQTIGPPLGLGYIASCLEKEGYKVKVVESIILNYKVNNIRKEIIYFNPDVVGISSTTRHISDAFLITKIAKKINPNCLTILGGPHPSALPNDTLKNSSLTDIIVRGEGEKTIVDLLDNYKSDKISNVKGITYRKNGKIIENPNRKPIKNLDSLPHPAYHLMNMDKYKVRFFDGELFDKHGQQYSSIITSRGCPYECQFCSSCRLWGKNWRSRSPENIIEELKILRDKYSKKVIDFMDDTFTVDKKRVLSLCELIRKEDLDISLICTTRVDLFNKEIARALKKAGCFLVYFGIESGVQQILDSYGKGFTLGDIKNAVKIAKDEGIDVIGSFMVGEPNETEEMIEKTADFATSLNLRCSRFSLFVPYPGTKSFELAEKNNLLITKDWSKYDFYTPLLKNKNISSRKLKKILKKAYFNANVKKIF